MYKVVIGLEIHIEMKSQRKVFSDSKNEYNEIPNLNVSPVDLALPGILPVLNKECLKNALKMASVLNCTIQDKLIFDRKNYYYPDLPKGYQITQFHFPIGINGKFNIPFNNEIKEVLIHDIHLEEDTARLNHYSDCSLIDYNRAGIPLIEIVTEPCFYSAEEVLSFLEYLISVLKYCNISEADTKKGQIRCDVNVNLKNEQDQYITPRVEVKNVNSLANIYETIIYETKRQIDLYENNLSLLIQETRRFDEETNTTIRMRTKEESIDYKYFIEPNIPIISIDQDWLKNIVKEIPLLPYERKKIYLSQYNLSDYDASIIVKDIALADYYEKCINLGINPKIASNWLTSEILGVLNKESISIKDFYLIPEMLYTIINKLDQNIISSKQAKEIFNKAISNKIDPKDIIEKENITQITDTNELESTIQNILDNNQNLIIEYHNGKTNVFQYLVGQIMKETKGKANPNLVKDILTKIINKKD